MLPRTKINAYFHRSRFSHDLELSLLGGMELAGELRLEYASGNRLAESDYDAAPFAGALVKVRF